MTILTGLALLGLVVALIGYATKYKYVFVGGLTVMVIAMMFYFTMNL